MDKQTYSVPEAGKMLGVGRNAAYQAVRRGEIPVIQIGRRLVVPKAALERLLVDPGLTDSQPAIEHDAPMNKPALSRLRTGE